MGSLFENHYDGPHADPDLTPCSDEPEMIERGAVELMAAIVDQSARDLAHTTDLLIEGLERDIVTIGDVLADVINVFDEASVVDRKTEARMRQLDARIAIALDIARRKKEKD